MEIIGYIFQNTNLIVTLVGGIIILAIIWNLFEHSYNFITQEQKNDSVIVLSVSLMAIVAGAVILATSK